MLKDIKNNNQYNDPFEGREGLVYARVSSKRQETEGGGLVSQEGRCIKELQVIGVPYIKTFPDSYTGGGDFMKRPAMREMLAYIDSHPHKKFLIVFDDLKRLARDTEYHLKLRALFKIKDVSLKCLNHNFEESPEGRFVETVLAGGAELEREQNKRQVIQKMKARMELGYWAFNARRPYKMFKDPIHGHILRPQEDAKWLKEALEGFASGRFVRKIDACRFLVEKGYWTKQSPEKYIDHFAEFLKDSFFAGFIEYPKWDIERRKGFHEPLISMETFELNKKRLKNEGLGKRIRLDISPDFPLRGLLLCDHCKCSLTGAWSRGRYQKYPYYFCQNKRCVYFQKSIRKKDIEDRFDNLLKSQSLKGEVCVVLREVFDKVWNEEVSGIKDNEIIKKEKKEGLEKKLADLTNLASDYSKPELVRRAYEKQMEEVAGKIALSSEDTFEKIDLSIPYQTALDKATGLLRSPYNAWQKLEVKEQQGLFYFIFDEKLPYDKNTGYRTEKIPTAIRLFEEFATANPLDVEMPGIEPGCIRVS